MTGAMESVDRALMGRAWVGSQIASHISTLCDEIGVRWAGTTAECRAAEYVAGQFQSFGLRNASIEEFPLHSWECLDASLQAVSDTSQPLDIRPSLFCPSISTEAPLVDVGYGTPNDLRANESQLSGAIALINSAYEPFSEPSPLPDRLMELARCGVVAAITPSALGGRRTAHFSAADWRDRDVRRVALPLVQTSREDGARLQRLARSDCRVRLEVNSEPVSGVSWNVVGDLPGTRSAEEWILVGAHHDTTPDSSGANDDGSGVAVLLEVARLFAELADDIGVRPGRSFRFVTFGAEEQGLQGSTAFVARHYGSEQHPKLMVNLDELGAGSMKGVVLQFPELRGLIQKELDSMHEGLQCHVLSQMDASGDMFPFAVRGVPVANLWRWRFVGRHADSNFGHCSSDTPEKLRIRELKEYAGLLARLLYRLSHVPAVDWPANALDPDQIATRIEAERGTVLRTM